MFRQLCLLALFAVTCTIASDIALKGLLPPYPLTKLFGHPGCTNCHPIDVTTTIADRLCDPILDLAAFGCIVPTYVNITVRDWKPVKDIVVPVPKLYRNINVHRSQPCEGVSLVEIHAQCTNQKV